MSRSNKSEALSVMRSKMLSSLAAGIVGGFVIVASSLGCAKVDTVLESADGGSAPLSAWDGTYTENWPALAPNGKVDILFAIDNSLAMADKQNVLADSAAKLIEGLVRPPCVSPSGVPSGSYADPNASRESHYGCPAGTAPVFRPVNDMHVGAVSSSLGSFGGDICTDADVFFPRTNDNGHLLASPSAPDQATSAALKFFPWALSSASGSTLNELQAQGIAPITDENVLVQDIQALVKDVGERGCGLEAQLESVYHFLVAPDPWQTVARDESNGKVRYNGLDVELLAQRKRFLRPDSFLAIVMLTQSDDSTPDPLAISGLGWAFANTTYPGSTVIRSRNNGTTAPRATTACATDPGSPECTSCGFARTCKDGEPECERIKADPACTANDGYYGSDDDELAVRYYRMKERFGVDPQYPIRRYVDALTHSVVPARDDEHPVDANGKILDYLGTPRCRNPIFAGRLPSPGEDTCNLPAGPRRPEQVAFLLLGGVPNQLVYTDLQDPRSSRISPTAWTSILGLDVDTFKYDGIDHHMIQSVYPRFGLAAPESANDSDPVHGREWNTNKRDLQYACTFSLPAERICGPDDNYCECPDPNKGGPIDSPICNANHQLKAKAYPTPRELRVVKGLGDSGIVGSICPIQITDPNAANFGYREPLDALVRRMTPFLEP